MEELHYQWLRRLGAGREQDALLTRRVKRNTCDGLAWRELTLRRLGDFAASDESKREAMQPLITELLAHCRHTAPEGASTHRVIAEWCAVQGLWEQAVESCFEAMALDPANFYTFSMLRGDLRQKVSEACRDALALLPHDHAAKGLAHIFGEMCATQGGVDAFRDTWSRYASYFTGRLEEGEWLEPHHRYLLKTIPELGACLERGDGEGFRRECRRVAKKLFFWRFLRLLK